MYDRAGCSCQSCRSPPEGYRDINTRFGRVDALRVKESGLFSRGLVVSMKSLVVVAIVLSIALLVGCGRSPQAQLTLLPSDAVILAFGDSLTLGSRGEPGRDWPSVLARAIDREVINAGVSGEVSAAGRERLPGVLARERPNLVLLTHGGNDLLRQLDREALIRNLEAMIDSIEASGALVVLVAVPEPSLIRLRAADLYADLAVRRGVVLEFDAFVTVLSDPALRADRAHPNAAGNAVIAAAIKSALTQAGAL